MSNKSVKIKEYHIKLLKNANISMECGEWDAPGFDTKRPYGSGDLYLSVYNICKETRLDLEGYGNLPEETQKACENLHKEMENVLQILCHHPEGIKVGDVFMENNYKWERQQ